MSGIYRGPNGSATADALNIDGNKGDLTISNSGLEWTINPGVVTTTKLGGDITIAGKALLDDADASTQRTTLGLGDASTANIGADVLAYDSNLQAFVDTFTLPTTDATNGFVLTTNGAGTLSLTAPGGIADDDYGDITVSTGGTVWTVNNDAITTTKILDDNVTYAKIQNVSATDKILGRVSSGAGDIEEITCTSAGRDLLDDANNTAQRTTLGLGNLAVLNTVGTSQIDNLSVTEPKLTQQIFNDLTTATFNPATDLIPFADTSDSGNKKKGLLVTQSNIGTFTRDLTLASGTQEITGVGFRPSRVNFSASITSSSTSVFSIGVDNGNQAYSLYDNAAASATTNNISNVASIFSRNSGANAYTGLISAFSDDGFTITWTRTGTPTGTLTISFIAEK